MYCIAGRNFKNGYMKDFSDKNDLFIYAVDHCLFANSPSAFGVAFKGGKNLGKRIKERKYKNFDELIRRMEEMALCGEEELMELVCADQCVANLYYALGKKDISKSVLRKRVLKILPLLIADNFDALPEPMKKYVKDLRILRYNLDEAYFYFLSLLFYGCCSVKPINKTNFYACVLDVCVELREFILQEYPMHSDLIRVVDMYINNSIYIETLHQSRWGICQLLSIIFHIAVEPEFQLQMNSNFKLFDWDDEDTYFVEKDRYKNGDISEVWWFNQLEVAPCKGYYFLSKLKYVEASEQFKLEDKYLFCVFDENTALSGTAQMFVPHKEESVMFGDFDWDMSKRRLFLDFGEESGFVKEMYLFERKDHSKTLDLEISKRIDKFENEQYGDILRQVREFNLNQDFLTEQYDVKDVVASRERLTLIVEYQDKTKNETRYYSVDKNRYEFLNRVLPETQVAITKHEDGKVYANWYELDNAIPLEDFDMEKEI